jgi:hypothetical protein
MTCWTDVELTALCVSFWCLGWLWYAAVFTWIDWRRR